MSEAGKHIVLRLQRQWKFLLLVEVFLYALGLAAIVFAISRHWTITIVCFLFSFLVFLFLRKPWKISPQKTTRFLDDSLDRLENSVGLSLIPEENLTNIALLQRHKVVEILKSDVNQIKPQVKVKRAIVIVCALCFSAFLLYYFNVFEGGDLNRKNSIDQKIIFQPLDSAKVRNTPPTIMEQRLHIKYPAYTGQADRNTKDMNVKALEGSILHWSLFFDGKVDSVFIQYEEGTFPMKWNGKGFTSSMTLKDAGFYNFKFKDVAGASYLSELYAMEVIKDQVPKIEIQNLKQFNSFQLNSDKELNFSSLIADDYGISNAYIIATVSKGEGESVKFREERLSFDTKMGTGAKKLNLMKRLDLDGLQMEAGDELYFYVEAIDIKKPKENRARSETYFAVIRDTATNQFAVTGTMGADLMPDYFRSQRQLIIDTEKLIAERNKLSKSEFNSTSNELGYDQKALRLKYGEFMGDEADSGIQVTQEIETTEESDNSDDPLEEYTHDHDGSNEHNLVDHDHDHEADEAPEVVEDPLHDYLHNHDDPEESTLFTQSLKSKLRQAMSEMWDAELHLRLYTPEKSLPYQYKALKLIQEIKNSARIYVHRIGFDPPPIKEDKRLSGELTDVKTFQKFEEATRKDAFEAMRKSVARISEILAKKSSILESDKTLFIGAGNELAILAIKEPSKYLKTLQRLKWLSEKKNTTHEELLMVQSGLLAALPNLEANPAKLEVFENEVNALMLKELESND